MLEGKAKEDFRKYYIQTEGLQDKTIQSQRLELLLFYAMSESKQYGVLVDWFDSVGLRIEVKIKPHEEFNYGVWDNTGWIISSRFFNTRNTARQQAIKKANQIYNERTT